jgi:DNA polymerase V
MKGKAAQAHAILQLDLFTDYAGGRTRARRSEAGRAGAGKADAAGHPGHQEETTAKTPFIKGMNLQEGATTVERNNQIGGHKA